MKKISAENMMESVGSSPLPASTARPRVSNKLMNTRRFAGLWIELQRIFPDPTQPRKHFDEASLERLAATIRLHGIIHPIVVRWDEATDRWIIVSGERRWRAAFLAGLDEIPAIEEGVPEEEAIAAKQLVENIQRSNLNPVEAGEAIERLQIQRQWSQVRICSQLGLPTSHVSKLLTILRLDEETKDRVRSGEMTTDAAYKLASSQRDPRTTRGPKSPRTTTREFEVIVDDVKVVVVCKAKRGELPMALFAEAIVKLAAELQIEFQEKAA